MSPTPIVLPAPDLDRIAADVRDHAHQLQVALGGVRAANRDDVWRGARATAFTEELDHHDRQLRAIADQLLFVATRISLRAADAALTGADAGAAVPPEHRAEGIGLPWSD